MGQLSKYQDKAIAAAVLVPLVYILFVISGAGSGVIPLAEPREREPRTNREPSDSPFPLNPEINWTWFFGLLAGTVVFSLLVLAFLTWRRPRFGPDYHAPLEDDPYEREFNELVHLLGQDDDPSRAIRLIFEAAETKIEHLPKRVYPETPFEWSLRVGTEQPHLAAPLNQLCDSYAKSRFGSAPATTYDRDTALQALRQLKHLSNNIVVVVPKLPVLPWA